MFGFERYPYNYGRPQWFIVGPSGGFGDGHAAVHVPCGAIGRRLLARYLVPPRLFPLPARRGHQLLDLPVNRI